MIHIMTKYTNKVLTIQQLAEELRVKSDKLDEVSAKLSACVASNNSISAKLKEVVSEKGAKEEELALLNENYTKVRSRLSYLEAASSKDQQAIVRTLIILNTLQKTNKYNRLN